MKTREADIQRMTEQLEQFKQLAQQNEDEIHSLTTQLEQAQHQLRELPAKISAEALSTVRWPASMSE